MREEAEMLLVKHREDEGDCLEAMRELIAQGIKAGDLKQLQEIGIYTSNVLIIQCQKGRSVARITTGSQALVELLGGGIETSSSKEAFGEIRSGKTQLAQTFCVSTQLPLNMHGGNEAVADIDTSGTSGPDHIVLPFAERFGLDPGAVLDNVIYARVCNYEHQYKLLLGLATKLSQDSSSPLSPSVENIRSVCKEAEDKLLLIEKFSLVVDLAGANVHEETIIDLVHVVEHFGLDSGAVLDNMVNASTTMHATYGRRRGAVGSQPSKKKIKSYHGSSGKKKLKRGSFPHPNLHRVKTSKKKKARGFPLQFKEYRQRTRRCDVFKMTTWSWESRSWEMPSHIDFLLPYQPDTLVAVRTLLPDQHSRGMKFSAHPLVVDSWRDLGTLRYDSRRSYLVGSNYRWLVVAVCGVETLVYDRTNWSAPPRMMPGLPLSGDTYHALQAGTYLFVIGHPSNHFRALKMNIFVEDWTAPEEFRVDGHKVVMAGLHSHSLIVLKYVPGNPNSLRIVAVKLRSHGLPDVGRQEVIATVPSSVAERIMLHESSQPENQVRMFGDFVFLYRRPYLDIYDLVSRAWDSSVNPLGPRSPTRNESPMLGVERP